MCPAHHNMAVPNLKRSEMILVNVSSDGFLTLMNDDGELRSDIPLPQNEAVANNIRSKFESIGDDEDILVSQAMIDTRLMAEIILFQST